MRVLIVKTSSLGDVLHTLPAVTDAARLLPGIRFDWVVEEAFAEVPAWHAAVDDVIPVALRRWKHGFLQALRLGEPQAAIRQLRQQDYDRVIDAQGLLKSAVIARFARGPRYGLDAASAREPLAARSYNRVFEVVRAQHAVARVRQLFALALQYEVPDEVIPVSGRDVQCSNCGDTWFVHHQDQAEPEAEEAEQSWDATPEPSAPEPAPEPEPDPTRADADRRAAPLP